ncbi:PDZ domain-containing protein [Kiritimatiellota bacterium B12222]|nr:PDZ domain-containing protein [Kiritimatiellota bacterium B12222]
MIKALLMWLVLGGVIWAEEYSSLPELTQIQSEVTRLGSEQYEDRLHANLRLEEWGEKYPRYLLTQLVSLYPQQDDPEVIYRMEILLKKWAKVTLFNVPRGFLGINFEYRRASRATESYIAVLSVVDGSAADKSGLKNGDQIIRVDDSEVKTFSSDQTFSQLIQQKMPLQQISLLVKRADKVFEVDVFLGYRPMLYRDFTEFELVEDFKVRDWLKQIKKGPSTNRNQPVGSFEAQSP